jgi:hypothetical protein
VKDFIGRYQQSLINKGFKVLPQAWKDIRRIMIGVHVDQCGRIDAVAFLQAELDQI